MEIQPTADCNKVLPEKAEKSNSNRASRNKNEKDRRDKVNAFINELADLVPGYSPQSKKLDKATILKNTVDFMKVHNDLTVSITCTDTTSCLNSNELGQLMLEGYNAFLFVISLSGSFKFLSESVYDLLGYMKDELVEDNVFDYILPEDKLTLLNQLSYDSKTGIGRNSGSSSFYLRFKPKVDDESFHETLLCCGNFKTVKEEVKSDDEKTVLSSNETCFVVLAKLLHLNYHRDVSNWLSKIDVEFSSRQTLDGKFLYLDPRCIPITGYLPYEILGSMIYEYIHFDDVENISTSFEALLEEGEGETGYYRILTKGCQWIVIKTSSYISYNHWNSKPEFICSTHHLVRKRTIHTERETKLDVSIAGSSLLPATRSVQVDEISSAAGSSPMSENENYDDGQMVGSSELTTLNTLTNQASDTVTPTIPSYQRGNTQVNPAQMVTSFVKTNRGSTDMSQTTSRQNSQTFPIASVRMVEIARRENPDSGMSDPNLPSRNGAFGKNRQSSGAGFWSGQDTSVSSSNTGVNGTFQNPLAVIQQSQLSSRSPSRISSPSPQPHKTTPDEYFSSSSPSSPQCSTRIMQGYQSTTQYPLQSPQSPFGERYRHSSSPLPPVSPHPSSPYSVPPQSPANSIVSCQSPNHYTALSPAPAYHHSASSSYRIATGTSELYAPMSPYPPSPMNERRILQGSYPMSPQPTITNPSSPYDYPARSPQTSTISPEIYRQPPASPHSIQQNTLNHPRSPESNPLPSVQQNLFNGQSVNITGSSQLTSSVIDNLTQFPPQLQQQQQMASIYHQLSQLKKSDERSLRNCQVGIDASSNWRNTTATSPAEHFDRNYQSPEQFLTNEKKKTGSQSLEMYSPSPTNECAPEYDITNANGTQNINYDSQTSEQREVVPRQYLREREDETYQLTQEKTFNVRLQNSAIGSMVTPQNMNHIEAQRILQDQLLEKQNHLQNVIENQKARLSRIQGQIIFNAKAQFSLHEIGDLESTKQLQQQVHDLEMERKQQEARQRELKLMFMQKVNRHDGEALDTGRTSSTEELHEEEGIFSGVLQPDRAQTSLSAHYYTPVVKSITSPHATPASTAPPQPDSNDLSFNERRQNRTAVNASSTSETSSNQGNDYFSKFSASELETFFSTSSFPSAGASAGGAQCDGTLSDDNNLPDDNCGKEKVTSPSNYDSLLQQQKQLLEMQEEQRLQLVRQQQEQLLRLQQHQETILRGLQNTPENTQQEDNENLELEPQISLQGDVTAEDASSIFPHELSDEDRSIVNMLLAEEIGTELWTDDIFGIFDKTTSAT